MFSEMDGAGRRQRKLRAGGGRKRGQDIFYPQLTWFVNLFEFK